MLFRSSFIIMEKLEHLRDDTKLSLFSPLCERPRHEQIAHLRDGKLIASVCSAVVCHEKQFEISNCLVEIVRAVTDSLQRKGLPDVYDGMLVQRICEAILRARRDCKLHATELAPTVNKIISRICEACSVPKDVASAHLDDKAGVGIRTALSWLRDSGLCWSDLHADNVLAREDGQLVQIGRAHV